MSLAQQTQAPWNPSGHRQGTPPPFRVPDSTFRFNLIFRSFFVFPRLFRRAPRDRAAAMRREHNREHNREQMDRRERPPETIDGGPRT
eukprot:4802254-Pyramimonas_sp.AAC.1